MGQRQGSGLIFPITLPLPLLEYCHFRDAPESRAGTPETVPGKSHMLYTQQLGW